MRATIDKRKCTLTLGVSLLLVLTALLCGSLASAAATGPMSSRITRLIRTTGALVPIPAAIPHEAGDMIDRRIVPDLRWIARHFPIYVTDGYSGPLPNGEYVGCHGCHVKHSDHYNGLAVDIVPLHWSSKCDRNWRGITQLAHWAEPRQNHPLPPFRWVGYNGDAGHGCGNHLHLSWEHAPAPSFQLAEWVEVFPVHRGEIALQPRPGTRGKDEPGGAETGGPTEAPPSPEPPAGEWGGVSRAQTGGLSAHGD